MKKVIRNNHGCGLLAGCLISMAVPHVVCAQAFPAKPVRFVIGPAPELLPRLVGQRLSEIWGQQVVIDSRPGAGGIVAGDLVAKAAPDGYTWLMSTGSFYVIDAMSTRHSYHMLRDFAPVTLMAVIPVICVVHPSVPAKSIAELVQLAKAQPGKLNFASAGNGTTAQLSAELFKIAAKIDIVHVPYKGVGPALTDLLGGQVQLMFAVAQGAVPHVLSGKLRGLAITSKRRSPAVPDLPTFSEAGYPEIDLVGWNGVSVPIGVPPVLVGKINADVRKVLGSREMQDRLIAAGFDPADTTIAQFQAFIDKDVKLYQRIIKESKIRLD